jgi:hypothetical protein
LCLSTMATPPILAPSLLMFSSFVISFFRFICIRQGVFIR